MATLGKESVCIERAGLASLLEGLRSDGYTLLGPTVRDGAIVYDEIEGVSSLPAGWTERQEAGTYQLERRTDEALFGYATSPHSWKKIFFPPEVSLWKIKRTKNGMSLLPEEPAPQKKALLGVRSCDLHAMEIQSKIFVGGPYADPQYAARQKDTFVIVVQCGQAGGTCFCVSMKTGPRAEKGFDLALTELISKDGHRFLVEVGSEEGARHLARISSRKVTPVDQKEANAATERASAQMGRSLDTDGIKELLYQNLEHPRWENVASRCLACANCTMVCPTCFCSTVEDVTDLSGQEAERKRRWDSCFTMDHSYIHGGSVRPTHLSRYRQWLVHKLASWIDQFGSSGCVGCGRCITWCPVKIDITEEVAQIRATQGK